MPKEPRCCNDQVKVRTSSDWKAVVRLSREPTNLSELKQIMWEDKVTGMRCMYFLTGQDRVFWKTSFLTTCMQTIYASNGWMCYYFKVKKKRSERVKFIKKIITSITIEIHPFTDFLNCWSSWGPWESWSIFFSYHRATGRLHPGEFIIHRRSYKRVKCFTKMNISELRAEFYPWSQIKFCPCLKKQTQRATLCVVMLQKHLLHSRSGCQLHEPIQFTQFTTCLCAVWCTHDFSAYAHWWLNK